MFLFSSDPCTFLQAARNGACRMQTAPFWHVTEIEAPWHRSAEIFCGTLKLATHAHIFFWSSRVSEEIHDGSSWDSSSKMRTVTPLAASRNCLVRCSPPAVVRVRGLQGKLAQKKRHPPRTLRQPFA